MPATSDQRALTTSLSACDDADLARLLAARAVPPGTTWRDLFDAAEALLEPSSVGRGLADLPHAPALALARAVSDGAAVAEADRRSLVAAGLVDFDGRVFQAVAAAVAERPGVTGTPSAAAHRAPSARVEAAAAERAFTATGFLADVLLRALERPLGRIGTGDLAAGDRRVLVDSGAAPDAETAGLLVRLGDAVGLLVGGDRAWQASSDAREWVTMSTLDRWSTVAGRLRDALPSGVRTREGGWLPAALWPHAYPFDPAWPAVAHRWRELLVLWGLGAPDGESPPWAASLASGGPPDPASLAALLPPEVDRVFLQNDLTAISPGPLAPALDVRLRSMARRESRAQASTYRFDADTIAAAISAGETAESLRAFLTGISLTGLPQPLQYVIDRTATRHGLIRVGTDADTGHTRVSSDDEAVLRTVAVDQSLRSLGLVPDGAGLLSRSAADAVFWALADARYPVVAIDADGEPRRPDRARVAPPATIPSPGEVYAPLLARLRAGTAPGDAAWLERELDQAVRARAVLDVVVALPDGSERTFRLEATGLGGGRLRGRDRTADVERTVPLTSIRSVRPPG